MPASSSGFSRDNVQWRKHRKVLHNKKEENKWIFGAAMEEQNCERA